MSLEKIVINTQAGQIYVPKGTIATVRDQGDLVQIPAELVKVGQQVAVESKSIADVVASEEIARMYQTLPKEDELVQALDKVFVNHNPSRPYHQDLMIRAKDALGYSTNNLANVAGVAANTLSNWLRGDVEFARDWEVYGNISSALAESGHHELAEEFEEVYFSKGLFEEGEATKIGFYEATKKKFALATSLGSIFNREIPSDNDDGDGKEQKNYINTTPYIQDTLTHLKSKGFEVGVKVTFVPVEENKKSNRVQRGIRQSPRSGLTDIVLAETSGSQEAVLSPQENVELLQAAVYAAMECSMQQITQDPNEFRYGVSTFYSGSIPINLPMKLFLRKGTSKVFDSLYDQIQKDPNLTWKDNVNIRGSKQKKKFKRRRRKDKRPLFNEEFLEQRGGLGRRIVDAIQRYESRVPKEAIDLLARDYLNKAYLTDKRMGHHYAPFIDQLPRAFGFMLHRKVRTPIGFDMFSISACTAYKKEYHQTLSTMPEDQMLELLNELHMRAGLPVSQYVGDGVEEIWTKAGILLDEEIGQEGSGSQFLLDVYQKRFNQINPCSAEPLMTSEYFTKQFR